jgi:hypothetical protein
MVGFLASLRTRRRGPGLNHYRVAYVAAPACALALCGVNAGPGGGDALGAQIPAVQTSEALTPPYPDAGDPAALGQWFGRTTHLPAKSILAITDNAIFAAFPRHDTGQLWTVDVRIESITPQSTAKLGGRSIRLRLNVRCDNSRVRLNFLDIYPGADLTGAPIHRAPTNDWATPKPASYVADAVRLVCDKTFQPPFAAVAAAAAPPTPKPNANSERPLAAATLEAAPALRPSQSFSDDTVQIGAFSTPAASEKSWSALRAALPNITRDLSNTTSPTQIGGRTLYRTILHGFSSGAAAQSFCHTLRMSGKTCLVTSR